MIERGGERREGTVSHEAILNKLVSHDDVIAGMAGDIHIIKGEIVPLVQGIKALTWLGKAVLWFGGLAAASTAMIVFYAKMKG